MLISDPHVHILPVFDDPKYTPEHEKRLDDAAGAILADLGSPGGLGYQHDDRFTFSFGPFPGPVPSQSEVVSAAERHGFDVLQYVALASELPGAPIDAAVEWGATFRLSGKDAELRAEAEQLLKEWGA